MKDYLEKFLGVPPRQIKILFDTQATRTAIIQEIRALADDDRINFDDPILIYYAGHGSTELTPKGWKVEDPYIQMIIPQDYGDGVYGIRDRTIGLLINRIAEKKGNNIVCLTLFLAFGYLD
jgi:Caspase domain